MPVFTKSIDKELFVHYRDLLKEENCVFSIPPYTYFSAKSKNWQVTFYKSGKVVVQGREIDGIVKKYFEEYYVQPPFEDKLGVDIDDRPQGDLAPYPHIGIDESGKGDFFGPLVIAGCYLTEENAVVMKEAGAVDSKKLDDKKILALAKQIRELAIFDIIVIGNQKYNELYSKFKNLNKLLAWGHATVLENILNKVQCDYAISDKFAGESVIKSALKEKSKSINFIQQTKAESDTAVACASILARGAFVTKISDISREYGLILPKGASNMVLEQGRKFVSKYGLKELKNVSKTHFKTYESLKAIQTKLF